MALSLAAVLTADSSSMLKICTLFKCKVYWFFAEIIVDLFLLLKRTTTATHSYPDEKTSSPKIS